MQIQANKTDEVNSRINAKISQKTFDEKKAKVAQNFAKHAAVKGFRKGKAPIALVSKMYVEDIMQEARKNIIDDVINEGLKTLEVANEALFTAPYLTSFNDVEGGFEFEAAVCLKPIIEIKDVESLMPKLSAIEVTDAEVNERVEKMLSSAAPMVSKDASKVLENGDFAKIDFEGFVDSVAFAGGKASDYLLEIGSGSFIPGFEDGLLGMKVGESKDINVKFPDEYQSSELAGKDSVFKVLLSDIQTKGKLELNDENAKKVLPKNPDASAEKLKELAKEQLTNDKKAKRYLEEVKPVLLEKLVEKYVFAMPNSVVEQEIDSVAQGKLQSLSTEDLETYKDAEKVKELRESAREEAEKNVRITFIIDALAKQEGVIVNDQEVAQAIMMEALQSGQDPMKLIEMYKSYNLLPAVKMAIVEDKVLMKLAEKADK